MLKKTLQYEDFDGNQVVKDFYFNLTKAELIEQQLVDGHDDLRGLIEALMKTKENKKILEHFKTILASTVGVRVGDRFVKDDDTRSAFMDTNAYGEVVMEFFTDTNSVIEFFKGVIPKDLGEKLPTELPKSLDEIDLDKPALNKLEIREVTLDPHGMGEIISVTPVNKDKGDYTDDEILGMGDTEFYIVFGSDARKWDRRLLTLAMRRTTKA